MNIEASKKQVDSSNVAVTATVEKDEVNKAIAGAYKEVAKQYSFPGFRKGHAPRPVIDTNYGRDSVLALATNNLLQKVEPRLLSQLDIVAVGQGDYKDLKPVKEGETFAFETTFPIIPQEELSSYDPVSIEMPPAEVTQSEVDNQVEMLLAYQMKPVEVAKGAASKPENYCEVVIKTGDKKDQRRAFKLDSSSNPKGLNEALLGKKVGETVKVSIAEGDEPEEVEITKLYNFETPELTDELAKSTFGVDSIKDLKEAIKKELEQKKESEMPTLKHNKCVRALTERLENKKLPEAYLNDLFQRVGQNFMDNLSRQGQTVDTFLAMQNITMEDLVKDLKASAREYGEQTVALDAYARHNKIEVTDDEVKDEFLKSNIDKKDVDKAIKDFYNAGRLPEVKEEIMRNKAAKLLVEKAKVKEVDVTEAKETKKQTKDANAKKTK